MEAAVGLLVDVTLSGLRRLERLTRRLGLLPAFSAVDADRWDRAARQAGLVRIARTAEGIAGRAGPLHVLLSRYADSQSSGTRITVSGPAMPAGLTIRPEGLGTALRGARGVREVETGHDAFDAATWVEGPPTLARAVLDSATRGALRALWRGRLERPGKTPFWASGRLEAGVLRVDVPRSVPSEPRWTGSQVEDWDPGAYAYIGALDHLGEVLAAVVGLARRLATPKDVARRLAENLESEPVADVRRRTLAALAAEYSSHRAARAALLAACRDPDARVRVQAAAALGAEGRETLLGVASGEGAEDETTERAVAALGWHLTTPQARGILGNALRTRRERTARACLLALGRRRGEGVVATLAKVLAVEKEPLAAAAAEALGETGDASAEHALLVALARPEAVVRVAAAQALGRVGTTAAVAALKDVEARDSASRRAARQAVGEIQARAKGAAPGQLSLAAGPAAGALSFVEDPTGRLSLSSSRGAAAAPDPSSRGAAAVSDSSSRGAAAVPGDEGSAFAAADPSGAGDEPPSG